MKITEVLGTGTQVMISIEPEHPAEVALIKLLQGASAMCETNVEQPKDGLIITVTVKAGRY
jgi:hypothetical protein